MKLTVSEAFMSPRQTFMKTQRKFEYTDDSLMELRRASHMIE